MNLITIEPGALPEYLTPVKLETMPFIEAAMLVYQHGCEFDGLHIVKRREDSENVIVPEQWRNGGVI